MACWRQSLETGAIDGVVGGAMDNAGFAWRFSITSDHRSIVGLYKYE